MLGEEMIPRMLVVLLVKGGAIRRAEGVNAAALLPVFVFGAQARA
jgi:hypothetical protein